MLGEMGAMQTVGGGRYELEAEIAKGAIGTVWRARDTRTGERVAVKLLRPEAADQPQLVEAFLAEARILAELHHPCVVRARELVQVGGQYALIMDLVNGQDLRRRLRADGPLPPAVAVDVVAQVADALAYVHSRGIVHADVKPGNILVPVDGSPVRLADFGVARRIAETDPSRATHATPEYIAPEVIGGTPPRPSTDVYALGIVLYELVCGRSPYRGGAASEVLYRHISCVPVPPAGFPEAVWSAVVECLAVDPADRPLPGTLAERLRALEPALDGLAPLPSTGTDVVTWWPREAQDTAPVPESRRRATWTGCAAEPVSPAVGYSRHGSDLPIGTLPGAETVEPRAAVAVASVPAPFVVPAPAPVRRTRRARLLAAQPGDRRGWPTSVRLGLVAAAALVVLVGLGVTLMLRSGGHFGPPSRPVAVISRQPDGTRSGSPTPPSASHSASPAPQPSSAGTDPDGGTDNGSGSGNTGGGSTDPGGSTNGGGTTDGGGTDGGQVPGMPSVPGMGSPMPSFSNG
jgi:serine/threonine-protein kinase